MLPPQSGRVPHGLAAWRVALTGKDRETFRRSRLTLNPFSHVRIGKGWILFDDFIRSQKCS